MKIKKKLKDLTLEEFNYICYNNPCENCPISFLTDCVMLEYYLKDDLDLDKEIRFERENI